MRSLLATIAFAMLLGASAAQAEKRIFIVANNADGYGVDRCLASGDRCGKAAATAYCKSREFAQATSYPPGRQGRDHRRDPGQRGRLQRRQLRAIRRHRVLALSAILPRARRRRPSRLELTAGDSAI